eukprot:g13864.t1
MLSLRRIWTPSLAPFSLFKAGYFGRAFFWLDIVALISLLPETWFVQQLFDSDMLVAGRSTRLMKAIRLVVRSSKATRLNRFTRMVRVSAMMPKMFNAVKRSLTRLFTRKLGDKGDGMAMTRMSSDASEVESSPNAARDAATGSRPRSRSVVVRRPRVGGWGFGELFWGSKLQTYRSLHSNHSTPLPAVQKESSDDFLNDPIPWKRGISDPTRSLTRKFTQSSTMSINRNASSASMETDEEEEPLHFLEFKERVLSEEMVKTKLFDACRSQLGKGTTMKNIGRREHRTEDG